MRTTLCVLLVLLLVGLSTMFGYDLTRAKHEQILAQLTARRAATREIT